MGGVAENGKKSDNGVTGSCHGCRVSNRFTRGQSVFLRDQDFHKVK